MVKRINLNLYVVAVVIAVIALGVGVYAYNSGGPPSSIGHSAEELEGVCLSDGTNCPAGVTDTRCDVSGTCSQVCIGTDCQTTWPSSGVKSFVGSTSATYTGSGVGGYSGGDVKCAAQFGAGARMSYAGDFIYGTPTVVGSAVWYNTFAHFADGGISQIHCYGWTSAQSGLRGPVWTNVNYPSASACDGARPIACSR